MIVLNIDSQSLDERACVLSNFAATTFEIDGVTCRSVEGFIQGIKFPIADERRDQCFLSIGREAKRMARKALKDYGALLVWWQGEEIVYGSTCHHQLIARAIRCKFEQNKRAHALLLKTEGVKLTHDLGRAESATTSLPADVFIKILEELRAEFLRK